MESIFFLVQDRSFSHRTPYAFALYHHMETKQTYFSLALYEIPCMKSGPTFSICGFAFFFQSLTQYLKIQL